MLLLFTMPIAIFGTLTAAASPQYADAISDDKSTQCKDHLSDTSKCSPFILPFP
jgi:hypothetical protein